MNIRKVKQNRAKYSMALIVLGIILLAVGNIAGIGYGLYLWGGTGMAFELAAWTAFKFWIVIVGSGFVLFLVGALS